MKRLRLHFPKPSPVRRELLAGLIVCLLLVAGLGGWAATTRLDGAVIASGRLTVSDRVKQVQHREGGLVSTILVRDGTRVDAGEPMLRLDDTAARGNHAIIVAQLVDLVARRQRLRAEQAGLSSMPATTATMPGIEGLEADLAAALAAETMLFQARRTALAGQKDSIAEQIRQLRAGARGLEARLSATRDQVRYMGEELASAEKLMEVGLTTQRQISALRRGRAELEGSIGQLESDIAQSNIAIARSQLESLQLDLNQREQAEQELRDADARIAELLERRKATQDQLERLVVRAPGAGVVSQLAVHTVGGVIAAGAVVALVVPDDDRLVVEARIRPVDIDKVLAGQPARIRLRTLDAGMLADLDGEVLSVSADIIEQSQGQEAYYLARIGIDEESRLHRERQLVPGMPADVFLATTGRRTALQYLLGPLKDQMSHAMREG